MAMPHGGFMGPTRYRAGTAGRCSQRQTARQTRPLKDAGV